MNETTTLNYAIPDDLHRRLKIAAAHNGITLKATVLWFLEEGLDGSSTYAEWLESRSTLEAVREVVAR